MVSVTGRLFGSLSLARKSRISPMTNMVYLQAFEDVPHLQARKEQLKKYNTNTIYNFKINTLHFGKEYMYEMKLGSRAKSLTPCWRSLMFVKIDYQILYTDVIMPIYHHFGILELIKCWLLLR